MIQRKKHFLASAAGLLMAAALAAGGPSAVAQTTVDLEPAKDNSMYSEGNLSNGAGLHCFAGRTNQGNLRRALLQFDIASAVPAGATITAVELTINVSSSPPTDPAVTLELHRALTDWGEAGSDAPNPEGQGIAAQPGDATWNHRFFSADLWTNQGGDFSPTVSGSQVVSVETSYTFASTPEMVADAQAWLDDPPNNFGWVVTGEEVIDRTAKRFDSRNNATMANRPRLSVTYMLPTAVDAWELYE
jgi:hypothetical protein